MAEIDRVVNRYGTIAVSYPRIAKKLSCDTLLLGRVKEYETHFLGVYSQTSVGMSLRLVRAKDNVELWRGHHIATSHAGSVPLTPVDVAMGIYSATTNVSDEQMTRVGDDLFRRLLSTWERRQELDQYGIQHAQVDDLSNTAFYVTSSHLNLRSGPGMKFGASTVLKRHDQLTLLNERHTPWVQVRSAAGQSGYVHQRYISAYQ